MYTKHKPHERTKQNTVYVEGYVASISQMDPLNERKNNTTQLDGYENHFSP